MPIGSSWPFQIAQDRCNLRGISPKQRVSTRHCMCKTLKRFYFLQFLLYPAVTFLTGVVSWKIWGTFVPAFVVGDFTDSFLVGDDTSDTLEVSASAVDFLGEASLDASVPSTTDVHTAVAVKEVVSRST